MLDLLLVDHGSQIPDSQLTRFSRHVACTGQKEYRAETSGIRIDQTMNALAKTWLLCKLFDLKIHGQCGMIQGGAQCPPSASLALRSVRLRPHLSERLLS